MKKLKFAIATGILTGALAMPGASVLADDHGHGHGRGHDRDDDHFRHHASFRVPPGHLPPPGKCRIWFPDRPPGHQPPSGDCWSLSHRVPRGAFLISGGGRGDRRWSHEDLRDHRYSREVFEGRREFRRPDFRKEANDVHQARRELRDDRNQLRKDRAELKKDRAELLKDLRNGASKKEIRQDWREIRQDKEKLAESRRDVKDSRNKLNDARQDLRDIYGRR